KTFQGSASELGLDSEPTRIALRLLWPVQAQSEYSSSMVDIGTELRSHTEESPGKESPQHHRRRHGRASAIIRNWLDHGRGIVRQSNNRRRNIEESSTSSFNHLPF